MRVQLNREAFAEWLAGRPKAIQELAANVPPDKCYRSLNGAAHYMLLGYDELKGGKVGVRVIHGKDSFGAGFQVFGMQPEDLVPCDCGDWENAGVDEREAIVEKVEAMIEDRKAAQRKTLTSVQGGRIFPPTVNAASHSVRPSPARPASASAASLKIKPRT